MNSFWILSQLPPKDAFYSSLTEEDISEIDYTHAQRVFNHFNRTDQRDYHNFYLLTNVLLLADVFKSFRDMCLQHFGLDRAQNYTPSSLSWQAALKMTEQNWTFSLMLINICSLRKGSGEGWQWSATDTLEPTSLAWKTMTPANVIATQCIWTPTTHMDEQ